MHFELRYAIRQLLKSPGFSLVAIVGLGLGIGANVALFSVINSVFLRPLPYRDPGRPGQAELDEPGTEPDPRRVFLSALPRGAAAPAGVQRPRAVGGKCVHVDRARRPEQLVGLHASASLLPALGLEPLLGRNFSADEDRPGGEHVVLISHRIWQERFNREPSVLGQALTLNGAPYTIIGVLPEAASAFPLNQFQIWVPRPAEVPYLVPSQLNNGGFFFQAVARLRPGVSLEQAREAMNVIAAGYRAANPANVDAPSQIEVVPLLEDAVGEQRQSYLMLFGAVGCVLLIACANIANLLLARFAGRRKEIAARFALGASRADVVRQLVMESMLLALLGGVVGVLLAQWALGAVVTLGADLIPRAVEIRLDPVALGVLAAGDARHRAGDRAAARAAGGARERQRDAQGSQPRLHRRRPSSARGPAGRRSVVVARAADRRRPAAHELRPPSAGRARVRARGHLHGATRAAAAALRPRQAGRLLRAVLSAAGDDAGQHVGGAHRSRAADRRTDAGADRRHGPLRCRR